MNSFKYFLEKGPLNTKEYIFSYKNKFIIRSNHKRDQYGKRNSSNEHTHDLFKKAINWLIKNGKRDIKYAFISKSTLLGMMVDGWL